jgi:transposase InsO family protein
LNDGSCIRLRPERRNHVWSYDFVEARTHDGRKLRLMTLIDEFTRECLAIRVARRINSLGVIETNLTGSFWTKRFVRNCLGKEPGDGTKEVQC